MYTGLIITILVATVAGVLAINLDSSMKGEEEITATFNLGEVVDISTGEVLETIYCKTGEYLKYEANTKTFGCESSDCPSPYEILILEEVVYCARKVE